MKTKLLFVKTELLFIVSACIHKRILLTLIHNDHAGQKKQTGNGNLI